ncbi:MAG: DUF4276 family protein [Planctomycetota bacterium]
MSHDHDVVVYFFGEGKTDLGEQSDAGPPSTGVVPILVHRLCDKPARMLATRRRLPHLQGRKLWQKVRFAKRQAFGRSAAAVFVVDSEGNGKLLRKVTEQLKKGRDAAAPAFPMAIGVAHPCIEAWLLGDASAIRRALRLSSQPGVPDHPEQLSAPREDEKRNPKRALAEVVRPGSKDLAAKEKWAIAAAMNDMGLVRQRCPRGFAPFADEIERHIHPLF